MKRIRITVSTVWTVNPEDTLLANEILETNPAGLALDYLQDSIAGAPELSYPESKWEEILEGDEKVLV